VDREVAVGRGARYASALDCAIDPGSAAERAGALKRAGFTAQKWFLQKWLGIELDPQRIDRTETVSLAG
jgi:hypothetical protein